MEPDVAGSHTASKRHAEGLNRAIEVFVINAVLIMPYARRGIGHFVGDHAHAVGGWRRLELNDGRSSPGENGRFRSLCRGSGAKTETGCSSNSELTIRHVIVHVALVGV